MKLYYLGVWTESKLDMNEPCVELCNKRDLTQWGRFTKSFADDFMTRGIKIVVKLLSSGVRTKVEQVFQEQTYVIHAYNRSKGLSGVIISDGEYPATSAQNFLSEMMDKFLLVKAKQDYSITAPNSITFQELPEFFNKYKDPVANDPLLKTQKELDETVVTMQRTVRSVAERGERLQEMEDKSQAIQEQANKLFKQARAQNSCCIVM